MPSIALPSMATETHDLAVLLCDSGRVGVGQDPNALPFGKSPDVAQPSSLESQQR
jgi:hypothetical protein